MSTQHSGPDRPSLAAAAALLSDLVSIDSINPSLVPGAAGEGRIARYVGDWLARAGLAVELQEVAPGRPNVIARLAGSPGRTLLLNAHMDTVGVAGMERPFEPRVEGNRLYGRGAQDMKGSLAAIMLAAQSLAIAGDFAGELLLTAVADEEYASLGTEAVVRSLSADAAIVTEPTDLRLCTAHKGFAWINIETRGRAAHGSKPDLGVDAIAHMGRVLGSLETLGARLQAQPSHPLLNAGSLHASLIEGGQELSSYPDRCLLQVERRTIPGETADSVLAEIDDVLNDLRRGDAAFEAHADLFFWRDAFEVGRDAEIVRLLGSICNQVLGSPPSVYGDTPWMDAALLSAVGIPTVVFGPGGAGLHSSVEFSALDEVTACAEVLALAARRFCLPA